MTLRNRADQRSGQCDHLIMCHVPGAQFERGESGKTRLEFTKPVSSLARSFSEIGKNMKQEESLLPGISYHRHIYFGSYMLLSWHE